MTAKSVRQPTAHQSDGKVYTYRVICSFTLQHSFSASEVEHDPGGDEGDLNPTDRALRALEKDLRDMLGQNYAVSEIEAYAESDELLGIGP